MGFLPTDLSDLLTWYDAGDTSTITAVGNFVSQWDDKSGNGHNLTQGVGSNQPVTNTNTLNARNVLIFDGSDIMSATSVTAEIPLTIFAVTNLTDGGRIVEYSNNGGFADGFFLDAGDSNPAAVARNVDFIGAQSINAPADSLWLQGAAYISTVRYDGLTLNTYRDGGNRRTTIERAAQGPTATEDLFIGGRDGPFLEVTGDVAEIIIYERALTEAESDQVGNYLSARWGITWTAMQADVDKDGLQLWLDASDAASVSHTAGVVDAWNDKSGFGRNFVQSNASFQPTYDLVDTIDFNRDRLDGVSVTLGTFFAVMDLFSGTSSNTVIGATGGFGENGARDLQANSSNIFGESDGDMFAVGETNINGVQGTSAPVFNKGIVSGTRTKVHPYTYDVMDIGNQADVLPGRELVGQLNEIRVWARELSLLEQDAVGRELALKWGTPWSSPIPQEISDLEHWYDASDPTTITEVGGFVSGWADKSGNGNNLSQTTGSRQPQTGTTTLNSLNTILFDGIDDNLRLTAQNLDIQMTVFVVVNNNTVDSILWEHGTGGSNGSNIRTGSPRTQSVRGGTTVEITGTAWLNSGSYIAVHRYDGADLDAYRDGQDFGTSAGVIAGSSNQIMNVGSRNQSSLFSDGEIAELLSYQRALTISEMNDIGVYLGSKWGITWTDIT